MQVSAILQGWGWTYDQFKAGWLEVERLGFDACYMGDDLFSHHWDQDPSHHADTDDAVWDPWTFLPAVAEVTSRMGIGCLVSPVARRNPGVWAKTTSITDIISGGRLIVGVGLGDAPPQHKSVGQPYPRSAERAVMLQEELTILRSMWTQDRTNFEGKYYKITDGVNSPKPLQKPHPPIVMGFRRTNRQPRIAAEFADRVNFQGADDVEVMRARDALERECKAIGRDFDRITKGRLLALTLTDDDVDPEDTQQVEKVLEQRALDAGWTVSEILEKYRDRNLFYVGPASRCAETLRKRTVDIGVTEVCIAIDFVGEAGHERTMTGLRRVAEQILPDLQKLE